MLWPQAAPHYAPGSQRSLSDAAKAACDKVGPLATPVCDRRPRFGCSRGRDDPRPSSATRCDHYQCRRCQPTDAQTRYGVELQFLVNHISHFSLVNQLLNVVRNGSGRIVIVSSSASINHAPAEGIMFDNLDGHQFYEPLRILWTIQASRGAICQGTVASTARAGNRRQFSASRCHERHGPKQEPASIPAHIGALDRATVHEIPFSRSGNTGAARGEVLASRTYHGGVLGGLPDCNGKSPA